MPSSTGRLTGMVGTALYVSPEVQGSTRSAYNQVKGHMVKKMKDLRSELIESIQIIKLRFT